MLVRNFFLVIVTIVCPACGGKNAFTSAEKADAAEDAAIALEDGESDKAIELLESELASNPGNPVLMSLLSAAYAQRAGLDFLELSLNIADPDSSSSGKEDDDVTFLWPFLPDASSSSISDTETAVELLQDIDASDRTASDTFKLSILATCLMSLRMKSYDLDGDGELSDEELAAMILADAASIFSDLDAITDALGGFDGMGDSSDKATETISNYTNAISNAEGETQEEQLQNYFEERR